MPPRTHVRRVLIVVSSYAPTMIADMQRARMLAAKLPKLNWEVEVLTAGTQFQHPSCIDIDSDSFFPKGIPTHAVNEWFPALFRWLGMRSIGWRALLPMLVSGYRLLRTKRYDLILLSTTQFVLFLLGPLWRLMRIETPYILDFHDPCVREGRATLVTTKHRIKAALSRNMAVAIEYYSVRFAAAIISVSPSYIEALLLRYRQFDSRWSMFRHNRVIPFGALKRDLCEVQNRESDCTAHAQRCINIIYVGAGGVIMLRAFALLCLSLARLLQSNDPFAVRTRIFLYGTVYGWSERGEKELERLAQEYGLGAFVQESPQRVTYRKSLELLANSDGALILGVDDEGYMPSKLFSYALSGKPVLAVLHRLSPAYKLFKQNPRLGHCLGFGADEEIMINSTFLELRGFLEESARRQTFDRKETLEPFLARAMADQHVQLFEECLKAD